MQYRSKACLLGLPLVHVATAEVVEGRYRRGVAIGWFAVGDVAVGVLFSCGGVAVGGFSLGGAALGLVSIGGAALGVLAVGGLAVGIVALGGAAIAWYAAIGGLAVAHDYAIGGLALARSVLTPPSSASLPVTAMPHPPFRWSDALLVLPLAAALLFIARFVQKRRKG